MSDYISSEEDEEDESINKKIKKKIKKYKLPNDRLIVLPNADKGFQEHWDLKRSKCNFPASFRCLIAAMPSSGKTNTIYNMILNQGRDKHKGANKPFETIYLIHCDPNYTSEYNLLGNSIEILESIPTPQEWEGIDKSLVILEDLAYKDMNKVDKESIRRLFAYCSTHKNISVICTLQDFHSIDSIIRRCTNLFILFPSVDCTNITTISKKVGLKKEELEMLFRKYCKSNHDSIWLDMTDNNRSLYPIRLNCFNVIKKNS